MAEVTAMRNNALPYPIYGAPYVIVYPFRDADGDLVTGATTPDAEISKNGDTFADCSNESTEIATSSGVYYLSLTATELTTDVATVIAKSATAGMKTTAAVLYPAKLVTERSGTAASAGSSTSTIVLDGSASSLDDYYNGMVCIATIDSTVEVRMITDYNGSNKTCTVVPDWNTAPDSDDTFIVALPVGMPSPNREAAIKTKTDNLPNDPADASDIASSFTTVNTKIDTIDDFLDTEIAAIKTKTDQLSFGVTNTVNANITHVNEIEVTGDGEPGTEWGPV